jgi:hypothetical protein
MQKAYQDCFLLLTKTYYQSENPLLIKFLAFTYKELLKTYLGGRMSNGAINVRFFQLVFEQNPGFGWKHLLKIILKCIVATKQKEQASKEEGSGDILAAGKKERKKSQDEDGEGARSNH